MSRIAQEAHAAIRHRVVAEGHSIVEVASAYGCTPANIYRILKLQPPPDTAGEAGDTPASSFWVQTRLANQTTADLGAAIPRLRRQFEWHTDLMRRATSLPDQDDAEAQQRWQDAMAELRSGRADGMAGHMRISLALVREIVDKTAELHRRGGPGRAG